MQSSEDNLGTVSASLEKSILSFFGRSSCLKHPGYNWQLLPIVEDIAAWE